MCALAVVMIAACGGSEAVEQAPVVVAEAPLPVYDDKPVRTCAVAFAPQKLAFNSVGPLVTAMNKRWLVGRRGEAPVLLHLDEAGKVAEVPLPRLGDLAAVDGERSFRMVWTTAPQGWLRVDLRDRDRPIVGRVSGIPGLTAGEYPKAVAADDRVVLVSLMRDVAGGGSVTETSLLDAATGERLGAPSPWLVWRAHCTEGRCFGAADGGTPEQYVIAEFTAGGVKVLATFERRECGGMHAWVDGPQWRVGWSRRGSAVTAAVDLQTGEVTTVVTPGEGRICSRASPVGADGEAVSLPDVAIDLGEGLLTHQFYDYTPTDLYSKEPTGAPRFTGFASYRRYADPEGKDPEMLEIPYEDASIPGGPGARALWLTRPGTVGVVFTGADGGPATYLPIRETCPSVKVPTRAPG